MTTATAHRKSALAAWNIPHGAGVLRYSGAHFLVAMVLMLVVAPFVDHLSNPFGGRLVEGVLLSLVLMSAVLAVGGNRRILITSIVLLVPALVAKWVNHARPELVPAEVFLVFGLLFVGYVALHLFRYIICARRVDSEVLCVGVATFFTLGLLWALAYILTESVVPHSFSFSVGPAADQEMKGFVAMYFSLVTLCTVGFGDIVPVSGPARMLAMLEGATGVFYVAVLVARLVSLYSIEKINEPGSPPVS